LLLAAPIKRSATRERSRDQRTCLAVAGAGFAVCGKYLAGEAYQRGDVVMLDGASFVALKNAPGVCPGDDWRLLAMRGAGPSGQRGLMGLRGERGLAASTIQSWQIDSARYVATPIMNDGSRGPPLELRALFEQFLLETSNER